MERQAVKPTFQANTLVYDGAFYKIGEKRNSVKDSKLVDDDYYLFGAGYDDDDLFDATADLLSNHPEKRRSHAEMDDTFKMDVIDLD